jgi:hypothetical protein
MIRQLIHILNTNNWQLKMSTMKINNLFQYAPLERDTKATGERVYLTPTGALPSVTTILSATADKSGLDAWRAAVGDKKADQIRDEATGLGTLMHEHLENHMLGVDRPRGSNLVRQMAKNMADQVINRGLVNVDEIWGIEAPLYMPMQYAGTADLIATYHGSPAVCDFKTTNKMKTVDMIQDYFCQCAAYAQAHNTLFNTEIRTIVIFMVSRDLKFNDFVIQGEEFDHYLEQWKLRVKMFYDQASAK